MPILVSFIVNILTLNPRFYKLDGTTYCLDNYDRNSFVLKKAILSELIPEVSLGMYINSIDFVLYSKKGISNE